MGRFPHAHWSLRIIQPVISPIQAVHQTLEVHILKSASTRDTISKGGDVNNAEHMESKGPKVTGTVKERYFIKTYFSSTRPIYKVLHQYILFQGWNESGAFAIRCLMESSKFRGKRKRQRKV